MKDILIRAGKTFIQAFIGSLAITINGSDLSNNAVVKSLLIGALSSGISAVMNYYLSLKKGDE